MIKATKPVKSTSSVPYEMLMTKIFQHYNVPFENEPTNDDIQVNIGKKCELFEVESTALNGDNLCMF